MKVYFSHGRKSGPRGRKIEALTEIARTRGCSTRSIDYTDEPDLDRRAERLLRHLLMEPQPCILVGTSMGAQVSMMAAEAVDVNGLFLVAPSLYAPGTGRREFQRASHPVEIVHGWSDQIEPHENSIMFARQAGCTLHLIPGDHGLRRSLGTVAGLFERFLDSVLSQATASRSVRY